MVLAHRAEGDVAQHDRVGRRGDARLGVAERDGVAALLGTAEPAALLAALVGAVAAVVVLQLISTLAMLYLPSLNARIIDEGVARGDTARIWDIGLVMLGVALVQVVAAIAAVWFGAKASMGVGRDLRRAVYTRVDVRPFRKVLP